MFVLVNVNEVKIREWARLQGDSKEIIGETFESKI